MDKSQELRTNLVLEADKALTAIREISGRLNQISQIKFDNVKQGFDTLTRAFEAAQKMSSKVAKVQTEDEKKLQNLLQERKKLLADMMEQFSKQKSGLSVKVDMSAAQKELQKTTRMVADMYDAMGQTPKAKKLMGEALNVLTKLSNAGMKGIGLEAAKKEYKDFERQIQNTKNLQNDLDRQVSNGIAEQRRRQAVKNGLDPFDDPVYAKSEVGKKAKKAAAEAAQAAKDKAALQKHLQEMQSKPSLSDEMDKKLGVNENIINTPSNKRKRKKQEERAKRLTESTDDNLREKALQYEQKVRSAIAKGDLKEAERLWKEREQALQYEQRIRHAIENGNRKEAERLAREREVNLQYEQKVRLALAKGERKEAERLANERERVLQEEQKIRKGIAEAERKKKNTEAKRQAEEEVRQQKALNKELKKESDLRKAQDEYEANTRSKIAKAKYDAAQKEAEAEKKLRQQVLDYETKTRSALARAQYKEKERQERLAKKEEDNRLKLQQKVSDFQKDVDFEKRPGNVISDTKFHSLENKLRDLKRMADGIGATDISAKLTHSMLDGINVLTKAQQEKDRAAKQAEQEENRRLKEQKKVLEDIAKLYKEIQQHKGKDGQGYSATGYQNAMNRIEELRNRAYDVGLKGDAALLNPSLLQGVNTKLSQFNTRISEAKDKAQELYLRFRETRHEADRLNFLKAKNDLRELENLAEDFNKSISKAARHDLTVGNIAKRAREHFNWTAGAYVENKILEFPQSLISDVSKYELAMAGVAQVLPKAEQGQAALNEQFRGFADTAAKYGQNLDGVVEAAKSIGRMYGQGDGNADVGALNTQILTQQAAKMATVDNFDMLEATRGLESALSQFNLQTEDSNLLMQRSGHILDVWTKLAHSSGASAQDLTAGVSKAGAAAKNAGVSFEMLNSLIAVGVRSTAENGGVIGNSLKSMFSSILSDKNIKNMEQFGIQIYKIGQKGTKELRPMKDIILDISKALSENPKNVDTKGLREFMMPISGGKQQYSRVMAILGNYKELQRTMNLADDSNGFTNKQLELQLDTVSRKFETLKANVAQLFVNSGADGLANDLKWILDCLNRLTHALATGDTHFYKWAKYGTMAVIAWKAIPALINMATKALARFNVAKQAGSIGEAAGAGLFGGIKTNYQAEVDKQKKARMKKAGIDTHEMQDAIAVAAGWDRYTQAVEKNTLAQRLNDKIASATWAGAKGKIASLIPTVGGITASTQKAGTSVKGMMSSVKAWGAALGRGTGAIRVLTTAIGLVGSVGTVAFTGIRAAAALLGGPIGIAITLVSLLGTHLASMSVDADLAKDKIRELAEETDNLTVEVGNEMEQMAEQTEKAQGLAEQYNNLVDKLKELQEADDDSTESAQRQNEVRKEMGEISSEIQEILHANALEFDEDGKINKETVENLAQANHKEATEKVRQNMAKVSAEKWATDQHIKATKARIAAMKAEANDTTMVSAAYRAMYTAITLVKEAVVNLDKMLLGVMESSLGGKVLDAVFGKHVVDGWIESSKERIAAGVKENDYRWGQLKDPTQLWGRTQIAEAEAQLKEAEGLSESLNDQWNAGYALLHGLSYDKNTHTYKEREKINPTKENPNEGTTATEPKPPKGKKGRTGKSGSGRTKKEDYLYDDDESRAFSTASKHVNQSYSSMGVNTPVLQAIANALNGGNFKGVADPFHNGAQNAWDSSYNFAEQLKTQFQSGEDLYTALDNIFKGWGIAWKDVIDKNAKELQDKYDYKKHEKKFKDPTEGETSDGTGGTRDVSSALQSGINAWLGATMDLHGVGCVEAVEKIGSFYSDFLREEFTKGIRYIPTLMKDAEAAGIKTMAYDASQLEVGDVIVWANSGDTQNHVGIYRGKNAQGQMMAVDNSSGADQIVERAVDRSWQRNEYIIKTGGGKGAKSSRWNRGGDGLDSFDLNPVTELLGRSERYSEWAQREEKRMEIEEKLTGNIADISERATKNMEGMLDHTELVNRMWLEYQETAYNQISDYLDKHPAVASKVGGKAAFFDISDTAKQELAKAAKDKNFEKAVKNFITAQKNFEKSTSELEKENFKLRRKHGFMTADEKYRLQSHKVDRQLDTEGLSWEDKLPLLQRKYDLAVAEMARLDKEYAKMAIDNQKEIDKVKEELFEAEKHRKEILAKYDEELAKLSALDEKKKVKELEKLEKRKQNEIKQLDADIERKKNELADRANGTSDMRDLDEKREKQQDTIKELGKEIEKTAQAFRKAGADVSVDFFDKLLLQGKEFKECLKDIVNEIAKIALKNLIYSAFGIKKQPLEEQGDIGMLLSGIGRKKKQAPTPAMEGIVNAARPFEGMGFGRSIWGRNPFPPFAVPQMQWGYQGGVNAFSLLQQPLQQATQGMTALTTGLTTANGTMTLLNGTTQILNTTQVAGRVATTLDTTAKHSEKLSVDQNTAALRQATSAYQAGSSIGGASGGGGGLTVGGIVGSLFSFFRDGGKIPAYATGGYTNGLIRGAGTGTSDSILTYLAHRGQFIQTSNGEYIIKKSSVDKLGVGFLDTLNNNPDAIGAMAGLKRYATGGNLGDAYSPSMTLKGVDAYKTFNKANMEKQQHFSTRKMETLLQGLRDDVQAGGRENTVTQPVILNTQADSASVMKAIAKNPRALQSILGKQNKRGFR